MLNVNQAGRNLLVAVVLLVLAMYLLPLEFRPLFTPDETRYAEVPREMVTTGNWVVPYLGGLRYFEKPVMGYWLGAISQLLFGENNFAVRFPSAFTTLAAAVLLFLTVLRLKGLRTAGLTTAIFLSCALVYFIGTFSVLDAPTALFITGSLLTFYLAFDAKSRPTQCGWLAVFGAFCGAAFLCKGFIAFVVPGLVIAPFLMWEKRWKEMLWMPWIPLVTAVLVALPWAVMIHYRDSDFWRYFVIVEHWERFFKKNESQHPEPFWYFIPVIIGGLMPWTLLLPGVFAKVKPALPKDSFTRFCWCWLVFPFLFFSASSGKLGTYILPCFPAVAFLSAVGIDRYFRQDDRRITDWICRITGILLLVAVALFVASQLLSSAGLSQAWLSSLTKKSIEVTAVYGADETWKWVLAALSIAFWGVALLQAAKAGSADRKLWWFGLGVAAVFVVAHPICPRLAIVKKAPGPFFASVQSLVKPDDMIVCYKNSFAAASWYFKRSDLYMFHKGGELEYGLAKPEAKGRLISIEDFAKLVKDPNRKQRVVFIMQAKRFREMIPPAPFERYDAKHDQIMFAIYD